MMRSSNDELNPVGEVMCSANLVNLVREVPGKLKTPADHKMITCIHFQSAKE